MALKSNMRNTVVVKGNTRSGRIRGRVHAGMSGGSITVIPPKGATTRVVSSSANK